MATTYCTRSDIEAIIVAPAVLACIDDDQDGHESTAETAILTGVIERAATEMNSAIGHQYVISEVTGNAWCKWANATLAAYKLRTRRANPAEQSIIDAVVEIQRMLVEIRWGREHLPEQHPSFDHRAVVSNFHPELNHGIAPIRVDTDESTGSTPVSPLKRNVARQPGY